MNEHFRTKLLLTIALALATGCGEGSGRDAGMDGSATDSGVRPAPEPRCVGTITPCETFDEATCAAELDCMPGPACWVPPENDCDLAATEEECGRTGFHCLWSGFVCSNPGGCSSARNRDGCHLLTGCEWATGCHGARGTCGELTESACTVEPDCRLECAAPFLLCGDECIDRQRDANHCGACDQPCAGTCRGGMCEPDACSVDADCGDDGLGCNGTVRCRSGRCMAEAPLRCDDGLACTRDQCVEPGTCTNEADDSRCAEGWRCAGASGDGCIADGPCEILPQARCPEGQACYDDRNCHPEGRHAHGETCDGLADCEAGVQCLDGALSSRVSGSICANYCRTNADCGEGACLSSPGASLGACEIICEPVTSANCPEGWNCLVATLPDGTNGTSCFVRSGDGEQMASCTDPTDCSGGYSCISTSSGSRCLKNCWLDNPWVMQCPTGASCIDLDPGWEVQDRPLGVCF